MEAEVLNEVKIVRPTLNKEVYVDIPEIPKIEHNLDEVKEYVLKLSEFYDNVINIDVKMATEERSKLNSLAKIISRIRIDKVNEYKEPISDFENTAKEIEGAVKDMANKLGIIVKEEEERLKNEKLENVINPIINKALNEAFMNNYLINKNDIEINPRWFNKTFKNKDIETEVQTRVNELIADIENSRKDIKVINDTLEMCDTKGVLNHQVYIERYNFTRDLTSVLDSIKIDLKNSEMQTVTGTVDVFNVETPVNSSVGNFETIEKDNNITCSFRGNIDQVTQLRIYAQSLGMEEI